MTSVTYHLPRSCEVIKQRADIIQDRLAITALVFWGLVSCLRIQSASMLIFFSSEFIRMTFSKSFLQSNNTKWSVCVIITFECIYFTTIFIFFIWFYNKNKKNAISIQFLFKFITLLEIIHLKSGLIHSTFCFLLSAFCFHSFYWIFSIPSFLFLICNFLFDSFYSL